MSSCQLQGQSGAPPGSQQGGLLQEKGGAAPGHSRGSWRHGVCTRVCSPVHTCFQIVFCHGVGVSHADCSRGFARPALRVTPGLGSGSGCLGDRAPPWAHGVSARTSPWLVPLPRAQGWGRRRVGSAVPALVTVLGTQGLPGGGCSLKVTHHLGLAALWMGIVIPDSLRPPPQGASAAHLEHGLRSWPGWPRAGSGGEGGLPDRGVEGTPMPPSLHPPASPEVWGGISISKPSLWLFKSTSFRLGGLTLLLSFLARNQFLL